MQGMVDEFTVPTDLRLQAIGHDDWSRITCLRAAKCLTTDTLHGTFYLQTGLEYTMASYCMMFTLHGAHQFDSLLLRLEASGWA